MGHPKGSLGVSTTKVRRSRKDRKWDYDPMMRVKACGNCLLWSKRLKRCKLKEDLFVLDANGMCIPYKPIPEEAHLRTARRNKQAQQEKAARHCIGCNDLKDGWCNLFGRWASNARANCSKVILK